MWALGKAVPLLTKTCIRSPREGLSNAASRSMELGSKVGTGVKAGRGDLRYLEPQLFS